MSFSVLTSLTPRLPGLPPLAFNALTLFSGQITALDSLNPINLLLSTPAPVWGIFDQDGNAIVEPDSVISFEYKNDWSLSNYPQEKGAFSTYNKVNSPFDVRIRFAKGGDETARADFLSTLQNAGDSLDLYSVVTPEVTYLNANIEHIDYRREQKNGANILIVEVWLVEIRSDNNSSKYAVTNSTNSGSLLQQIGGAVSNAVGGGVSFVKNTVQSVGSAIATSLGQVQTVSVPDDQQAGFF